MTRLTYIILLLLLTLGWALPSEAAVTFFWRAEGTTLSGTDDLPGADTSATATGAPAINATAALVGSNGIQVDAGGEHYTLDNDVVDRLVGSVGFWIRIQTWAAGGTFWYVRGSSYTYAIRVAMVGTDELRLQFNEDVNVSTLDTTAANLATNTTYFVTASWDQPNNDRRLRVYDSSGTLIHEAEDTSTAYTAPVDLAAASNGHRFGEASGAGAAFYLDNIFVGGVYADADTFLCNRSITTYTSYAACGGGSAAPRGLLLGVYP